MRLPDGNEWTPELLIDIDREIAKLAKGFNLDTYPNQLEIITSEQMMDAYSSTGLPTSYSHWSFGKSFIATQHDYKKGYSGLAYEIVINSNPCIAYLMEENSLTMQALVIAHASYGHNSFFKGNYLFRQWTDAEGIVDYMIFAKNFIAECENKYGATQVELVLDSCHALQNYGVDKYKRPHKLSAAEEKARLKERMEYQQSQVNDMWRTIPGVDKLKTKKAERFPPEPQENILHFIEEHSPQLPQWKREIIRIVRNISQYFYPQRQTQVMNEGWATFWHYTLLNKMYEEDMVGDGFMIEFLHSHAGVTYQPPHSRINPYALGFAMMRDIERICKDPTDEDREWFPELIGSDWLESLDTAMRNYRDESFIRQYLSPKIIRDFRLYGLLDDDKDSNYYLISAIHNDEGYQHIRNQLAESYDISDRDPDIQVYSVDTRGDRRLTLHHRINKRRPLNAHMPEILKHVVRLWGHDVMLRQIDTNGAVANELFARRII